MPSEILERGVGSLEACLSCTTRSSRARSVRRISTGVRAQAQPLHQFQGSESGRFRCSSIGLKCSDAQFRLSMSFFISAKGGRPPPDVSSSAQSGLHISLPPLSLASRPIIARKARPSSRRAQVYAYRIRTLRRTNKMSAAAAQQASQQQQQIPLEELSIEQLSQIKQQLDEVRLASWRYLALGRIRL